MKDNGATWWLVNVKRPCTLLARKWKQCGNTHTRPNTTKPKRQWTEKMLVSARIHFNFNYAVAGLPAQDLVQWFMVLAAISGTKHTHSIRTGHGNTDAGTPNTYFAWNYVTDEIIQNKNMFFFAMGTHDKYTRSIRHTFESQQTRNRTLCISVEFSGCGCI